MTTILITGANRGLGLEMVRQYSARTDTSLIACCRDSARSESLQQLAKENPNIEVFSLDVVDHGSIEQLGAELGDRPVDVLVNNAGIFGKTVPATTGFDDQQFGRSDFENDWIMPFRTNALGPMKLVETLVENIARSDDKKVVVITSIVASITLAQGHMFGYAASKAAANMTARNLATALRARKITVNPVHPGYAQTDMGGPAAHVNVPTAVSGVIRQIDRMSLERSGEFLSFDDRKLPW